MARVSVQLLLDMELVSELMSSSEQLNKESIKIFASQIVDQFQLLCPSSEEQINKKKRSQKGIKIALTQLYSQIYDYVLARKLGVIKRGFLARAIQSEMEQKAYERSLINQIMMAIILNSLTNKG